MYLSIGYNQTLGEDVVSEEVVVPELNWESRDIDEVKKEIAVISEAIDRCETILQHLAVAQACDSKEMDQFMCKHIELMSIKNKLNKKFTEMSHRVIPAWVEEAQKEEKAHEEHKKKRFWWF